MPESESFINYLHQPDEPTSLGSEVVISIVEDHQGYLWTGLFGGGLSRFDRDDGTFYHYRHDPNNPNSLSDDDVYTVFEDHQQVLWVGTRNGGLNRFDARKQSFTRFTHDPVKPDSLSHDRVYVVFEDSDQTLWIGTRGGGLNRFDRSNETFVHYRHDSADPKSLSSDFVYSVYQDQAGKLWVGTWGGGLNRFDPSHQNFISYRNNPVDPYSLSNNNIFAIYQDRTGVFWVGTFGGGINKFNAALSAFGHHQRDVLSPYGLNSSSIWSLHQGKNEILWLATQGGGVNRFDPQTQQFTHYTHDPADPASLSDNFVVSVFEDSAGTLWAGTENGGLNRLNADGTFTRYLHDPEDPSSISSSHQVYDVVEDSQGDLWVGTRNGLNRFNRRLGTFERFIHDETDPGSVSGNWIHCLFIDDSDRLWVGTQGHGLSRFERKTGQFIHYNHDPDKPDSLSHSTIFSMFEDSRHDLWFGTKGGLNKFDSKQQNFTHYREGDGLSNDSVFAIMEDKQGDLWITTNRGINRFDPAAQTFEIYLVNDGLQSNQFEQGAAFQAADGQIFAGGVNGFNAFYPEDINDDQHSPTVVLTDFLLLNQSVPLRQPGSPLEHSIGFTEVLTLTHQDYVFSFEFAALHFADPSSNQYKYKLVGFDKDWITTSADKRFATYTNIPPGNYTFHVKGSNKDGVWNETDAVLAVRVVPAPWQTWWAYLLYGLLAGLSIMGFWRERHRQMSIRLEAAEQVADSEKRLSFALWGSRHQLWDWDLVKGVVLRRNILAEFDFPELEPMGSTLAFVKNIHPADRDGYLDNLQQHMQAKTDNFENAYRMKNTSNEWTWVMNKGRVVARDEQGNVLRMTGVLINVHELYDTQSQLKTLNENLEKSVAKRTLELQSSLDQLKDTQGQLIQSEKMAALSYLVAGVAHEVNTPLGVCVTVISLQLENLEKLDAQFKAGTIKATELKSYLEQSQEQMRVAQRNIHRSADLINNFKQVAVEQTHEVVAEVLFDQYLQKVIDSVLPRMQQQRVSLNVEVSNDILLTTYPGVWAKVITNLIDNSLIHGFALRDGGQVYIGAEQRQGRLHFYYRDNGKGMSDDQVKRVFDPFYTTNRESGGTGLGMHIVYNLVTLRLLGRIDCTSSLGDGVAFNISTPLVLAQADN